MRAEPDHLLRRGNTQLDDKHCHFQKWAAQAPAWRGGFAGKF
jgi:hypothetical protein